MSVSVDLAVGRRVASSSATSGWLRPGLACACALALLSLGLGGCSQSADAQGGPPQAPPVSAAPAVQRTVVDSEEFSGRLEATEYVELRPRVSGTIEKIHFSDGAFVQKGQQLFTIDPRPFEAEAARAQSQLAAAKARAELAQSELARARTLLASQAISARVFWGIPDPAVDGPALSGLDWYGRVYGVLDRVIVIDHFHWNLWSSFGSRPFQFVRLGIYLLITAGLVWAMRERAARVSAAPDLRPSALSGTC